MRSGKMTENVKRNLTSLLEVVRSPLTAWRIGNYYKVGYYFRDKNEADNFRKLLLFNVGFNSSHVETLKTYRKPGYIIYVRWHASKQEELIKNIEEYLQEDNMGPTDVSRENTKFYAIIEDAEGKKTAYEIQYPSLTSRMECCFDESTITHTVEFYQDYMKKCDCVFTERVKQKDELEKLRAENEKLKARLGNCENQLRKACEFLNGYGDIYIDIPTELKNLDYFSSIVNYTTNGETKRREFGKKVAEQVKKLAGWYGVWREPKTAEMITKDKEVLEDAVETAINPFYVSCPKVCGGRPRTVLDEAIDFTAGLTYNGTAKADRFDGSVDALSYSALLCRDLRLKLNSVYGITAASIEKINKTKGIITPIFDAYDSIKDVKFANPATIVFWKDGTKTVVKAQGDEEYVPEVGLAMCICKKVMGNTRDYYRVFKHWMKKVPKEE